MNARTPDPIDQHVGARLRMRRAELKISQEALGQALGVSFQQIQKYERGNNRVSASMLYRCAHTLEVMPAYFFDGLAPTIGPNADQATGTGEDALTMLHTADGAQLALAFNDITDAAVRRQFVDLARATAKALKETPA